MAIHKYGTKKWQMTFSLIYLYNKFVKFDYDKLAQKLLFHHYLFTVKMRHNTQHIVLETGTYFLTRIS